MRTTDGFLVDSDIEVFRGPDAGVDSYPELREVSDSTSHVEVLRRAVHVLLLGQHPTVRAAHLTFLHNPLPSDALLAPEEPDWFKEMMAEGENASPSIQQLAAYINGINTFAEEGAFSALDDLLSRTGPRHISVESLLTLVRATFPFRTKLSRWESLREIVGIELARRGQDAARLLRGL